MSSKSISLQDFRDVLYGDDYELDLYWDETKNGGERSFHSERGESIVLEILTSIPVGDYYTREKNDAIRTQLRDTQSGEIIDAETHTKRTDGWEERLVSKINALSQCPEDDCSGTKRVSDGQYGLFFYCTDCDDYSESLSDD
jgi:hypothetical protein